MWTPLPLLDFHLEWLGSCSHSCDCLCCGCLNFDLPVRQFADRAPVPPLAFPLGRSAELIMVVLLTELLVILVYDCQILWRAPGGYAVIGREED